MASSFGAQALYKYCVGVVSGILAKSYTANTTVEQVKTPDECGENIKVLTKNVVSSHDWEGEITGTAPSGICLTKVGQSMSAPAGIYLSNMQSPGSTLICTNATYTENSGEWARFSVTGENNAGI